jgi:hypothetical protein
MPQLNPAIVALNKRNKELWRAQQKFMEARMADEAIAAVALKAMAFEGQRQVPTSSQTNLEMALVEAEEAKRIFLSHLGRSGGKSKKCDALQELIMQIVRQSPSITHKQLLERLREHCPIPPTEEIDDGTIFFTSREGRAAEAKISGLKDRLSRARKQIRANR